MNGPPNLLRSLYPTFFPSLFVEPPTDDMRGRRNSKLAETVESEEPKGTHAEKRHCAKRMLKSGLKALSPGKALPPSPPRPERQSDVPCTTLDPMRTAVEVSNYPPKLTKADIRAIFSEFRIGDFNLPSSRSFSVPLRVKIEVAGQGEAERAVKQLDGLVVEGKRIGVKLAQAEAYDSKEVVFEEIANEMKVAVISTSMFVYQCIRCGN